jgi:hypothetical protein
LNNSRCWPTTKAHSLLKDKQTLGLDPTIRMTVCLEDLIHQGGVDGGLEIRALEVLSVLPGVKMTPSTEP